MKIRFRRVEDGSYISSAASAQCHALGTLSGSRAAVVLPSSRAVKGKAFRVSNHVFLRGSCCSTALGDATHIGLVCETWKAAQPLDHGKPAYGTLRACQNIVIG